MNKLNIGITTDCVCDLPHSILEQYHIDLMPFHVITDNGRFCDMYEISSENVLEYIGNGNKAYSIPSPTEDYRAFFTKELKTYDRVIHISMTGTMSDAYQHAREAAEVFDGQVSVFDSLSISTGTGHLVIKAAELAEAGEPPERITAYLTGMRGRVSASFICSTAEYMYLNGRMSKSAIKLCRFLGAHPVIALSKEGKMVLNGFAYGNFDRAAKHYIRKRLKHCSSIEHNRIFITHAGCNTKRLSMLRNEVEKYKCSDEVIITKASATVSSNCGPDAFGVLFVKTDK